MTKTAKRHNLANAAAAKRAERAAANAAMQARHAARNAALAQYNEALTAWYEGGEVGPQPLDPRYRDRALFPENFRRAA